MPTAGINKKSFEENLSDEDSLSSIKENPNDYQQPQLLNHAYRRQQQEILRRKPV